MEDSDLFQEGEKPMIMDHIASKKEEQLEKNKLKRAENVVRSKTVVPTTQKRNDLVTPEKEVINIRKV